MLRSYFLFFISLFGSVIDKAQGKPEQGNDAEELLNKLSNPVANFISVPFQSNLDYRIGSYNGSRYTLNATVSAFFAPSNTKWGIGPTALILKQLKTLTYGFLANQIWSIGGDEFRSDVLQLYLQPFSVRNFKSGASISVNSEMSFNPRIPLSAPEGNKPDFGLLATVTLVFPQ